VELEPSWVCSQRRKVIPSEEHLKGCCTGLNRLRHLDAAGTDADDLSTCGKLCSRFEYMLATRVRQSSWRSRATAAVGALNAGKDCPADNKIGENACEVHWDF